MVRLLMQTRHNYIPHMEWEARLMEAGGLSHDQARFAVSFVVCIFAGILIRGLRNPTVRNLYSLLTGLLLLYYPFGSGILHCVFTSWTTYLVMWLIPRKCGTLAWLINFPYLLVLHTMNASGISWNKGVLDPTGAQMVLTLKLISTAMCLQDFHEKKEQDMSPYQRIHHLKRLPSLLEFFGYVFCFGNLLAGPIIEYRDYQDFIRNEGLWDPRAQKKGPVLGCMVQGLRATLTSALSCAFYISLEKTWGFHIFTDPWYLSQSLFMRLCVMQVVGTVYRSRYYFAWSNGWASLAFAGFDFLKWDDKTGKAVWGRGCNSRPLKVEFCDSGRMLAAHWNISTGMFLRRYVYERLTPPGGKPTFFTLVATQLVSSLWHGLYPGYFFFFVGSAFLFAHSTVTYHWEKAAPRWLQPVVKSLPFWAVKVFITKQCLDFLASSFLILTWRECLAAWGTVYFIPLIWMVGVLLLGQLEAAGKKGGRKGARGARGAAAAAGGGGGAANGVEHQTSGVADALAQGLQEAETAPRLSDDEGGGGKKDD
ncbi:lysophospholipid acyltransferase-like [Raphidocelis subcapitata]|uniref:Lysophospholipid acyltransferase-like n=1 Tax=Raphidocelis subcapitata TaxID=307507 RepID=A0A2V0P1C8_9CHLO|nr:lysophospholipid acyltransferase-like [Raphidocelis subcapitata]|eukprot:GBF90895.1 lysophospholipid acyltransferase-like [Raphidocelis subcapitata]